MNPDVFMLFERLPGSLPLYEQFERRIACAYPDVIIKVKTTQVSFYNTHAFAWAWPPLRRIKGRPGVYIIVTFGLNHRLEHPRIIEAVEPYPNRWTHHVIVQHANDIDDELMSWVDESYRFSLSKGRGRRKN